MNKETTHVYYINRDVKSLTLFLKEADKLASPTNENAYDVERDLCFKMRTGDVKARAELINRNLLYVVSKAKKYMWSNAALEDLIQAGNIGLIKAADRFDATLGYKFISYATWYIECEIRKAVTDSMKHGSTSVSAEKYIIVAPPRCYSDWDTRYRSALDAVKSQLNKRIFNGADKLLTDYMSTMQSGLTTSDFKKMHHLTDSQMEYFLEIVRDEGRKALAA